MSALAKYYLSKNASVSGYDKTVTGLTRQMEDMGIAIHYEDSIDWLDRQAQLVVYTPAVPKDHRELNYYVHHNYEIIKRSALLGEITQSTFNICIAGTHGKTTISTMTAHILRDSGVGCNAFLGGIAVNYNTNFWNSSNNVSVAEADEFDRSFLQLSPDIALISAMDADHLDIYGTKEKMEESFIEFAGRLRPGGLLITNCHLPAHHFSAAHHLRYSIDDNAADVFAAEIEMPEGGYQFTVVTKSWQLEDVQLKMGGLHNVENAVAAIAIAHHMGISDEAIKSAISNFKGVKRRFEYIIAPSEGGIVFIDDYAHHPQELRALISGTQKLFPKRKCTIIFQPHLFSRTKDFAEEFSESLDQADEVILLPIYPARELPVEGVSSSLVKGFMKNRQVVQVSKEALLEHLRLNFLPGVTHGGAGNVLITAGAGDIDTLIQPIREALAGLSSKSNNAQQ